MSEEDEEFVRIEKESLWRKRQIEEHLGQPVYCKKEWVGLTNHEAVVLIRKYHGGLGLLMKAEEMLREKNE